MSCVERRISRGEIAVKALGCVLALVAAGVLTGCSGSTVQGYIKDLASENVAVQNAAADQLGKLQDKTAVKPLCELLKRTRVKEIRLVTCIALGRIANDGGVDALIPELADSEAEIRMRAVEALGRIRSPKSVDAVTKLLDDPDIQVKLTAIWALGNIASKRSFPSLTKLLDSSNEYVRYNARQALKRAGEGS